MPLTGPGPSLEDGIAPHICVWNIHPRNKTLQIDVGLSGTQGVDIKHSSFPEWGELELVSRRRYLRGPFSPLCSMQARLVEVTVPEPVSRTDAI